MDPETLQEKVEALVGTPVADSEFVPRFAKLFPVPVADDPDFRDKIATLFAFVETDERNDCIVTVFVSHVRREHISSLDDLISNEPMDDFLSEIWEKLLKQTWRGLAKSYAFGTVYKADHFLNDVHMKLRKVIWKFDPRRSRKPGGPFAKLRSWIWSFIDYVFIDVLREYESSNREAMQHPVLTRGIEAAARAATAIRPDAMQDVLSFVFLVLNRVNERRTSALEDYLGVSLANATEEEIGRAWRRALRNAKQNSLENKKEIEEFRERMKPFTTNEILAFLLWDIADLTLHEVKVMLAAASFRHSSIGFIKKSADAVRKSLGAEVANDANLSQDLKDQLWDIEKGFSVSNQSLFREFIEHARNAKHYVRDVLGVLLR